MAAIAVNDLEMSKELDQAALVEISGGNQRYGKYSHTHISDMSSNRVRQFAGFVWKNGRVWRKIQYRMTHKYTLTTHKGWIQYV